MLSVWHEEHTRYWRHKETGRKLKYKDALHAEGFLQPVGCAKTISLHIERIHLHDRVVHPTAERAASEQPRTSGKRRRAVSADTPKAADARSHDPYRRRFAYTPFRRFWY